MAVAVFDLDNTLLAGDSDYEWGRFMGEHGLVDPRRHEEENRRYYGDYLEGRLDINAFLAFQLRPLAEHDPARLEALRRRFVDERIAPLVLPAGRALLRRHRGRGDVVVIVTATNRFITAPIAERLGVEHLLATEPERVDGRYTGRPEGIPCFREGKVQRLQAWLDERGLDWAGSWFYSDSRNDIPLLERVDHPVAVDPDPALQAHARANGWRVISLRAPAAGPETEPCDSANPST